MIDPTMTGTFEIQLPKDLVAHARRVQTGKRRELKVEGWRGSWLSRLVEKLIGQD